MYTVYILFTFLILHWRDLILEIPEYTADNSIKIAKLISLFMYFLNAIWKFLQANVTRYYSHTRINDGRLNKFNVLLNYQLL